MDEVWKDIPSVPVMMASSWGRVRLKPTTAAMPNGASRSYQGAPTYGVEQKDATARKDSPKRRIIRVNKIGRTMRVHRLVCEAFHGPAPSPAHIVLHLDEDPSNNRPENLRWGTRKENQNFPKAKAAFRARAGNNSAWAIHQKKKEISP